MRLLRLFFFLIKKTCITKNRVSSVTTLFFQKFCFSLRISYKELIWCTNHPNVHIHTFVKCWSFIWGRFFPVSIFKTKNQLKFCHKTCWKEQPFIFTDYLMNHLSQTSVLFNYVTIECLEINWLCKHMKRSEAAKQRFLTELSKTQFSLWV